jgi:drug/metabolite transporter (DMT)-like permease
MSAGQPRIARSVEGALWMALSCASLTVLAALIRHLSFEMDTLMILFFRMVIAQALLLPWLFGNGLGALKTDRLKLHAIRAVFTCGAMISSFYAWSLIPLAEVTALSFLAPIFATAGAALILHETVRARRWAATLIGFIGAMIVLRPSMMNLDLGHWLALAFAACMACTMLVVKSLSSTEDPFKVVFFVGIFMTPVSLVLALPVWAWPPAHLWPWLLALGPAAVIGHTAFVKALTCADASAILPFDFLRLPFAALLGFIMFGEYPDVWTWVGGAVIFASTFYISRREAQLRKRR